MKEILRAILFGIVEGITEWLPVSSTGHMLLLDEFIRLDVSEDFMKVFSVAIQLGAILAVMLVFWKTIWPVTVRTFIGRESGRIRRQAELDPATLKLWGKIIIACIPGAVVGILFDDWADAHFRNWPFISAMLILVGIAFLVVEHFLKGREPAVHTLEDITLPQAAGIGVFQLLAALFPGMSRSGATILGGLLLGVARPAATEFTFIMSIPVMAGASLIRFLKYGFHYTAMEWMILFVGMLVAFLVSMIVIRALLSYIENHTFTVFGIYRIVLGALVILVFGFLR